VGDVPTRPRVVIPRPFPSAGLDLLSARFEVEMAGDGPDAVWLRDHVPGAAAIIADPSIPIDAALLDAAGPTLEVVSNFGVGYDNIDLEAVRARGLRATNTPGVLTGSTAELAVALMLAAGRRVAEADAYVRADEWSRGGSQRFLGRDLAGATVGLIGFGRIGRRVAQLLEGFAVALLVHTDEHPPALGAAQPCALPHLLAACDFVSLHVPLTPQTRHLIDADALSLVKPGAILINTSRGGVVDTTALIAALSTGRLAAAGLDVYEDEPDVPAELRALPNTVLLPHIGSATVSTRNAMARLCAENVIAVIDGRPPPAAVV
jgi:glyoxylate reductase